ncbi:MAG: aminotransferase class I/II-fold pyridoxal phosphate-dependent enzyme [Nitrospirae bacterium]|nr:aminotransferase class I/II-fold pyridoxal phosphate-dependent enzyme [Nitrospirota bacterium]
MVVAIVIGRGGSKGFPGKNTYPLLGRPMMTYPILAAQNSRCVQGVYVSTDSPGIAEIADRMGVPILARPPELCTDSALGEDVFRHAFQTVRDSRLGAEGPFEAVVLLFCNSPTVLASTIDRAVEMLRLRPDADSVVTVSRYNMWSPLRARKVGDGGFLDPFIPFDRFPHGDGLSCDRDSQGDVWFADMGVSVVRPRCLDHLEEGLLPQKWMGRRILPLCQWGGLDVDYEWQIPQVEYWLRANGFSETATPYPPRGDEPSIRRVSTASAAHPHLARIRRVEDTSSEREGVVRLHRNEPGYSIPDGALAEMKELVTGGLIQTYPDVRNLKEKIARSELFGAPNLNPSQIVLTQGAEGAIRHAFELFVSPGDPVAFLEPTYAMVGVYADLFRVRPVPIPHGEDMGVDETAIRATLERRPRLLVLANPNSPTGAVLSADRLRSILEVAGRMGVAVLADEAYFLFCLETVLPDLDRFDNLLVCRTFSKAFGMPGLRAGFLAASPPIAPSASALRFGYESHSVALSWAEYLLDHPAIVREGVASVLAGKTYLESECARWGLRTYPTAANFSLIDAGDWGAKRLTEDLRERGFLVRSGFRQGPLARCIRVSAVPIPVMHRFVDALRQCLDDRKGGSVVAA